MTKEDLNNSSSNRGKPHVRIFGGLFQDDDIIDVAADGSGSEGSNGSESGSGAGRGNGSGNESGSGSAHASASAHVRGNAGLSKKALREQRRMERREWKQSNYYNHRGDRNFGLIIFFAGVVLLLNVFSIIPWDFCHTIGKFWPFLLIIWGFDILLGRNFVSRFVTFLVTFAACLFILTYGLVQVNSPVISYIPGQVTEFVRSINLK